jgi:hypothetical protein
MQRPEQSTPSTTPSRRPADKAEHPAPTPPAKRITDWAML